MEPKGLRALISFIVNKMGLVEAKTALENVEKGTKKLDKSFFSLNRIAKDTLKSIAGFFAVNAVFGFLKSVIVDFAKLERALSAVALKMGALGLDTATSLPKVRAYLQQLQDAGGPVIGETIPAFSKFIGVTKDVNAALAATKLAADISEGASIDLGTAAGYVADIMQGKAKGAAQALGIELYDLNGNLKTNAQILEEVLKLYGGMADRTDDAQDSLDKLSNSWAKIKTATGEAVAPLARWIAKLIDGKKAVDDMRESLGELDEEGVRALKSIGTNAEISDLFRSITPIDPNQRSAGDQKNIEQAARKDKEDELKALFARMEDGAKEQEKSIKEALDKSREAAKERAEAFRRAEIEVLQARLDAQKKYSDQALALEMQLIDKRAAADRVAYGKDAEIRKMIDERVLIEKEEKQQEYDRAREKAALDSELAILEAKAGLTKKGTDDWLEAQLDVLKKQQEIAILMADQTGQSVNAINEAYAANLVKLWEEWWQILAENAKTNADREKDSAKDLALQDSETSDAIAARRDRELKEVDDTRRKRIAAGWSVAKANEAAERSSDAIRKRAMADQAQRYNQLAQMGLGALQTLFGGNKSLAIASSLMNTYEAATRALAEGGPYLGPILAALMIAAGMKQVQMIRKQKLETGGKGFDDPKHDRMAEIGGMKWANDMVVNWQRGVSTGWAKGMEQAANGGGGSVSYDQRSTQEIHYHGTVIDQERAARKLHRVLRVVGRRDDQVRFVR